MTVINKVMVYILGVLLASTLVYSFVLHSKNSSLEKNLIVSQEQVLRYKENNATLSSALDTQNQKVKEGEQKLRALQDSMDKQKENVKTVTKTVVEYRDRVYNSPTLQTCDEAMQYIFDTRKDIKE